MYPVVTYIGYIHCKLKHYIFIDDRIAFRLASLKHEVKTGENYSRSQSILMHKSHTLGYIDRVKLCADLCMFRNRNGTCIVELSKLNGI
jgi:hypothetical protein